jgi:hypothetical protein
VLDVSEITTSKLEIIRRISFSEDWPKEEEDSIFEG